MKYGERVHKVRQGISDIIVEAGTEAGLEGLAEMARVAAVGHEFSGMQEEAKAWRKFKDAVDGLSLSLKAAAEKREA